MSAQIVNDAGKFLTFRITGKLAQSELAAAQKNAVEILQKQGRKRVLVLAESFEGWGEGDWGDLSGQIMLEPYLDRLAIVGEKKWESLTLLFTGKGIRRVPVEYFCTGDRDKAEAWLAE